MAQRDSTVHDLIARLTPRSAEPLLREVQRAVEALRGKGSAPHALVLLPPGAALQQTVIPAFWTLEPKYDAAWQQVRDAGSAVHAVVMEQSWPQWIKGNPQQRQAATDHLDSLPGLKLGYVSTRAGNPTGPILSDAEILTGPKTTPLPDGTTPPDDSVKAWYDEFGGHIDGAYFDELVLPSDPGAVARAVSLAAQFKAAHAGATLMILAGSCIDEHVVGGDIDIALMWEEAMSRLNQQGQVIHPYPENFLASTPQGSQAPPSWWKDPAHRRKIAHVVHGCDEPERQRALSLANERNGGLVFVMDQRGGPNHNRYDHLPNYFGTEVRELNSYLDFGLDPLRALRAASRYALANNMLHAWPNFEAAWYGDVHVRGTFQVAQQTAGVARQPIALTDLPGTPQLHDIPAVWRAAHQYAQANGKETAIPTFEQPGSGQGFALVIFDQGLTWLHRTTVALGATYERPTFAEPGFVIRNISRAVAQQGRLAAFPTFEPDDPDPRGRKNLFTCYAVDEGHGITWVDVPTTTYIAQL
jgi:hypothetical protein